MNKQAINNLAVYTSIRAAALSRFIRKYNLDVDKLSQAVMKYKNIRKDLSAAVSGYADNEIAQELVNKFKLNEGIMADEFFVSPIGRAVLLSAKRNDGKFDRNKVTEVLDNLNTSDLKWARKMDVIAINVGLNINDYNTYGEQLPAMLDAMERLYNEYKSKPKESIVVTKQTIIEMVHRAGEKDKLNNDEVGKRLVIDVPQFEYILNQVLNPLNKTVTLSEDVLADTYTFEVYSGRMKKFLDFIKDLPTISITKLKKDGQYVYLTLSNSGRFEEWEPVVKLYKEHIKI
jgi:hypothetical protein